MIRTLSIAAIAIVLASAPARSESATFRFSGTCFSGDMWNAWKIAGHKTSPDALLRPWETFPIRVTGYELVRLQEPSWSPRTILRNQTLSWFMLGTTIGKTDALLWMGPGETRSVAADRGQQLPSVTEARPTQRLTDPNGQPYVSGDLFTLHGQCYGGIEVTMLLTIFYQPIP